MKKKIVKLTERTYACNDLTTFECKTHPSPETEKEISLTNLLGKTCEITLGEFILRWVLGSSYSESLCTVISVSVASL